MEYNPVTDNLTLKAKDSNLKGVFALVSHKTGIWFRIDPSLGKRITIDLNNVPFESLLRQLSRGFSHAMIYERMNNGSGPRLVGIELVYNDTAQTRGSFSYGHGSKGNGSLQPDSGIYDHYTVDYAGSVSRSDTAPEQSFDMATTGFSSKAEGSAAREIIEKKIFVDSDTESPVHTPSRKIATPRGVTVTANYSGKY